MMYVVRVQNLHLRMGRYFELTVPEFRLSSGEIAVIRGSNGSGKTTFLEALVGLHSPVSGIIMVFDNNSNDHQYRAKNVKRIYYISQQSRVFESISIGANLSVFTRRRLEKIEMKRILGQYLPNVRLPTALAGTLSRGERLRLNLASVALSLNDSSAITARLAIMDEPFSGLDDSGCRLVVETVNLMAERGWGVIVVDHIASSSHEFHAEEWKLEQMDTFKYEMRRFLK